MLCKSYQNLLQYLALLRKTVPLVSKVINWHLNFDVINVWVSVYLTAFSLLIYMTWDIYHSVSIPANQYLNNGPCPTLNCWEAFVHMLYYVLVAGSDLMTFKWFLKRVLWDVLESTVSVNVTVRMATTVTKRLGFVVMVVAMFIGLEITAKVMDSFVFSLLSCFLCCFDKNSLECFLW